MKNDKYLFIKEITLQFVIRVKKHLSLRAYMHKVICCINYVLADVEYHVCQIEYKQLKLEDI